MHEMSVAMALVESVLESIKKMKSPQVEEIILEVGELAFISPRQLEFAFELVKKDKEPLKDAKLTLQRSKATVCCPKCGHRGGIEEVSDRKKDEIHGVAISFECPDCKGTMKIESGREMIIKRVVVEVTDDTGLDTKPSKGKPKPKSKPVSMEAFRLRDEPLARKVLEKIKAFDLKLRFMHVCGTHQDTLVKYGLEGLLLKSGIEIRQGPGCPVCVTTQKEIEEALLLAKKGKTIAAFGDMARVRGKSGSLDDMRAQSCKIKVVYGISDAVKLALEDPAHDVVFMGIGFETTTPSVASVMLQDPPENFSVLSCHRTVPPALKALVEMGEVRLDGLIEPGHVSVIIGTKPYEFLSKKYKVPQVIAGFEPLDLLMAIFMLARQVHKGVAKVENEYLRVVKPEGNPKALKMMAQVFEPCDVPWRGFPIIPGSGLKFRKAFQAHDARVVHEDALKELEGVKFPEPKGCKCPQVLRGLITSDKCPLFGKACTPRTPVGPCMVSVEGSCNILYKYGKPQ
jgi:hydrogenase expression/formation protein HypD